jgi:hypothetical protein
MINPVKNQQLTSVIGDFINGMASEFIPHEAY